MASVSAGGERMGRRPADPDPAADAASFAEVFARHYVPALRLAALLEGDPTRAEDAVCDAFARVYGRLRRGGVDDVAPYLRRAVVNSVRGGWRRRQVERRHVAALAAEVTTEPFDAAVVQRDE